MTCSTWTRSRTTCIRFQSSRQMRRRVSIETPITVSLRIRRSSQKLTCWSRTPLLASNSLSQLSVSIPMVWSMRGQRLKQPTSGSVDRRRKIALVARGTTWIAQFFNLGQKCRSVMPKWLKSFQLTRGPFRSSSPDWLLNFCLFALRHF